MSRISKLVSSRCWILAIFSALALGCGTPTGQRPLSGDGGSAKIEHRRVTDQRGGSGQERSGGGSSGKLVRSRDGISGRYIVVLASGGGAHVHSEATALAREHGGTVASVMDQLGMFVIEIDDSRASVLAGDARVTNVSQDRKVSIQAE